MEMHYPIKGTTRVLIWPKKLLVKKNSRKFDYKRPAFENYNDYSTTFCFQCIAVFTRNPPALFN